MRFLKQQLPLIALLISMLLGNVQAQEFTWGDTLKLMKHIPDNINVIRANNKGIYTASHKYYSSFLQLYNNELEPLKELRLVPKYNGKKYLVPEGTGFIGDKLYFLGSYYQKKKGYLLAQEIDPETFAFKGELRQISIRDDHPKKSFPDGIITNWRGTRFLGALSPNEKFLLVASTSVSPKSGKEHLALQVFDEDLNVIWEKKQLLPYLASDFNIKRLRLNNNGNVYLLGEKDQPKSKSTGIKSDRYQYIVLAFLDKGQTAKEYKLKLNNKDKIISTIKMKIHENNDIICAGFYADQNDKFFQGTYLITIAGDTHQFKTQRTDAFTPEIIEQHFNKKKAKKAEKGSLYHKNLILRDDGGVVLLTERTYSLYSSNSNSSTYFVNDIVVININPEGKIEWVQQVEKEQRSKSERHTSFAFMVYKDQIHVIYQELNIKDRLLKTWHATLNMDGSQEKKLLQSDTITGFTLTNFLLVPENCVQLSDTEFLLFQSRSVTQYRLGLMSFEEEE